MKNKKHSFRAIFKGSFKFANGYGPAVLTKLTIREDSIGAARDYVFSKYVDVSEFSISQNIQTIPMRKF